MTRKQRRLALIATAVGVLGLALGLVLYAMRDTIVFFHAPSDIAAKGVQPGTRFRLGGLVKEGSIKRGENQQVAFEVTDARRDPAGALPGPPAGPVPRGAGRRRRGRARDRPAPSAPTPCSPGTTRPTCRARSPTR